MVTVPIPLEEPRVEMPLTTKSVSELPSPLNDVAVTTPVNTAPPPAVRVAAIPADGPI